MEPRRRRRTQVRRNNDTEQPPAAQTAPTSQPVVEQPVPPVREPMRAPLRAEGDHRERARLRAAEILGDDEMLTEGEDKYYISPDTVPDGWSYEWKRDTVYGKPDPQYYTELMRGGWEPVPTERHPEMMPPGTPDKFIHREGLILMERPEEITAKVRARELRKATGQVRAKEEQLSQAPAGTFARGTHPGAPVKVERAYAPFEIPKDPARSAAG